MFCRPTIPNGSFTLIAPREDEHEYSVDHRNGLWFIRTNDRGRNFRLVTAPVATPGREHWTELIAHRDGVMLEDVDLFAGFFIAVRARGRAAATAAVGVYGRRARCGAGGRDRVSRAGLQRASAHQPDLRHYDFPLRLSVAGDAELGLRVQRGCGVSTLLKQVEVPGGFDRTLYASERVHAKAPDGVEVPVSIVYCKDKREAGKNPLYVYGYGSYGYSLPLGFSSNRLSLLDRGVVMAYAHIRGGGDLGKPWHDAGKMLVKRNTFTDFIAAVEHLTAQGYGDPKRVAIEGGSAGGLLMGAVVNMRPESFPRGAVACAVRGRDEHDARCIAAADGAGVRGVGRSKRGGVFPVHAELLAVRQLEGGEYPAMLVKTSLHDSQVMYWEPAKYVAKLRTLKTDGNPLLLVTNMQAGHGGASGRYDYLKEIALDYAFLLRELVVA